MKVTLSKATEVLEVKESASGLILKGNSSTDFGQVQIESFLVDETFTKKVLVPKMSVKLFTELLGVHFIKLQTEVDGNKVAVIPFSKAGSLPLDENTYIELHISGGQAQNVETETYQSVGVAEPIFVQQVKLDQNISVKDVDVLAYDYFVAEKTPNELQVINAQGKFRYSGLQLDYMKNARLEEQSKTAGLDLTGLYTLSVYKNAGDDYTFYLLDVK
ncbi:hypothetical protein EDL99_04090 [Ornithobacterium rhinotracheale]|uniref:hypothetical protein n=1 Tax=Ornithobacterium rhinotracheale TaxID=28251 RepID=UPI00129CC41D|nr:hypothetical protein [Ornithobacterium rhinotracheale]MRJ08068.1 hypothetical protein [Ornithobacterium rhinotracheale]UOH78425.1 hypothetical protein MT996_02900 [Ornithobacterium rhinotracheale]